MMLLPNPQVHSYIINTLNPFIQPLLVDTVLKKPENPVRFAIQWLTNYQNKNKLDTIETSKNKIESLVLNQAEKQNKQSEPSVNQLLSKKRLSGESAASRVKRLSNKSLKSISNIQANSQEKNLITKLFRQSQMVKKLQWSQQKIVKLFCSRKADQYELICRQDDEQDNLYIVKSGEYDCYRLVNGQNQFVKTCVAGDSFGINIYDNKQQYSSVVTKQPGMLLVASGQSINEALNKNLFGKNKGQQLRKIENVK